MNQYLKNLLHLSGNRLVIVFLGGIFTIVLAKNITESQFGEFALAQTIVLLGCGVSAFGMEGIVNQSAANNRILGFYTWLHAFLIQITLSALVVLILYIIFYKMNLYPELRPYFIVFVAPLIIIRSTLSVKYYFDGQAKVWIYSSGENFIIVLSFLLKIFVLTLNLEINYVLTLFVFESIVVALFLLRKIFQQKSVTIFIQFAEIARLVRLSAPFFISGLAVMLYLRMDIAFVQHYVGYEAVGNYALASRLTEIFYIVSTVYVGAKIKNFVLTYEKNITLFQEKLSVINATLFYSALLFTVLIIVLSESVVQFIFDDKYESVDDITLILSFTLMPIFLGSLVGRYYLIKHRPWIVPINTFIGLCINFVLNSILVPDYGVQGAAISTVISQFFSNILANIFTTCGRELFISQISSVVMPQKFIRELIHFRG